MCGWVGVEGRSQEREVLGFQPLQCLQDEPEEKEVSPASVGVETWAELLGG